jgi:hypothetical protein
MNVCKGRSKEQCTPDDNCLYITRKAGKNYCRTKSAQRKKSTEDQIISYLEAKNDELTHKLFEINDYLKDHIVPSERCQPCQPKQPKQPKPEKPGYLDFFLPRAVQPVKAVKLQPVQPVNQAQVRNQQFKKLVARKTYDAIQQMNQRSEDKFIPDITLEQVVKLQDKEYATRMLEVNEKFTLHTKIVQLFKEINKTNEYRTKKGLPEFIPTLAKNNITNLNSYKKLLKEFHSNQLTLATLQDLQEELHDFENGEDDEDEEDEDFSSEERLAMIKQQMARRPIVKKSLNPFQDQPQQVSPVGIKVQPGIKIKLQPGIKVQPVRRF